MKCSIERYPQAFAASQILLEFYRCCHYPIDIEKFINAFAQANGIEILIISEKIYRRFRVETERIDPYIDIKDGRTYYEPSRNIYAIVYNDRKAPHRIRFTLAHEFAHIVLGHLSDERTEMDRRGLIDVVYFAYEGAANTFAGNFLAPPIIIQEKLAGRVFTIKSVAAMFKISESSVRDYRLNDYLYWKTTTPAKCEQHLLGLYRCRDRTYYCNNCRYFFLIRKANFCPICGTKATLLEPGGYVAMAKEYAGIQIDANGRAIECPTCHHLTEGDGTYCMICGNLLVNYCKSAFEYTGYNSPSCNNENYLPGKARYCPYCGGISTFLECGYLEPWNDQVSNDPQGDSFSNLSDNGNEELPF